MARITPRHRLLHLRVLALRNVRTGYEPHQDAIRLLAETPITKLVHDERRINWLANHYRRQISPELIPVIRNGTHPIEIRDFSPAACNS